MAEALGYRMESTAAGEARDVADRLARVTGIRPPATPPLANVAITALCDVRNPLCGERGATMSFGPQKGIPPHDLERVDTAVRHFAEIVRRDVRAIDVEAEHTGAAGGLGFAMAAFCDARLVHGAEHLLNAVHFDDRCGRCDIVITGEGRVDAQTLNGKLVSAVARRAGALRKAVYAFAGRIDGDPDALRRELGIAGLYEASPRGVPESEIAGGAEGWLREAVGRVVRRAWKELRM
jgi:glycerate kinase